MNLPLWAMFLGLPWGSGEVKLTLEAPDALLRPGKAMTVRFMLENPSAAPLTLEEPANYLEGLQIWGEGGEAVKAAEKPQKEGRRTVQLPPRGFFGRNVDLSSVLSVPPEREGWFRLRWSVGEAASNELRVLVLGDWLASIETSMGTITLEFRADLAPNHVLNFLRLSRSGFYEGSTFHRIIAGFMMQGGQPRQKERQPTTPLKAEFSAVRHGFGTVSAARGPDPDSATSEFFICFGPAPHLDGHYTVFGQVAGGEEVVKEIEKVKTDHSPCAGCGLVARRPGATGCCGQQGHHSDKPQVDVLIKKITLSERK
jgi:cyclophilin family peptidyl-prolyl cis-trans isomerase